MRAIIFAVITCLSLCAQAQTAESTPLVMPKFEAGVGMNGLKDPNSDTVVGTIWLAHTGELKVVWDGMSLNAGSISTSAGNTRPGIVAKFPTVTFDLQKLLGQKWMDSFNIQVNSGLYDQDDQRGTAVTQIGTVRVNLAQKVKSAEGFQWYLKESVGGAAYYKQTFYEQGFVSRSVPVFMNFDSVMVKDLPDGFVLTVATGIYGTLYWARDGEEDTLFRGIYVNPELAHNKWTLGGVVDGTQMLFLGTSGKPLVATNMNVYVSYLLKKTHNTRQFLTFQVGKYRDETILHSNGTPHQGWQVSSKYIVKF